MTRNFQVLDEKRTNTANQILAYRERESLPGGQPLFYLVRELLNLLLSYASFAVENNQEASVAGVFELSILNGDNPALQEAALRPGSCLSAKR
jgi:hypothetical protein